MTRTDYVLKYKEHLINMGEDYRTDPDDGLSHYELQDFLFHPEDRFDAFIAFSLTPEWLAKIVTDIGGAEFYNWEHLLFIRAICLLNQYLDPHTFPYNGEIPLKTLWEIMAKLFTKDQMAIIPPIVTWYGETISIDRALGHILHAEQMIYLMDKLTCPPSGDDEYFDYYPGTLFYFSTINDWFLNSGIRIP